MIPCIISHKLVLLTNMLASLFVLFECSIVQQSSLFVMIACYIDQKASLFLLFDCFIFQQASILVLLACCIGVWGTDTVYWAALCRYVATR